MGDLCVHEDDRGCAGVFISTHLHDEASPDAVPTCQDLVAIAKTKCPREVVSGFNTYLPLTCLELIRCASLLNARIVQDQMRPVPLRTMQWLPAPHAMCSKASRLLPEHDDISIIVILNYRY